MKPVVVAADVVSKAQVPAPEMAVALEQSSLVAGGAGWVIVRVPVPMSPAPQPSIWTR